MTCYCSRCGGSFTPRRDYYHRCFPCWKAERDGPTPTDQWRQGYLAGHEAGYGRSVAVGRAERSAAISRSLDADLLMQVIVLTHPDRHPPERFDQANHITARLLALREAVSR